MRLATIEVVPESTWTRVTSITIRHVDHPKANPDVLIEGEVGVDTASAGFFDADFFHDVEAFESIEDFCCGDDDSAFPTSMGSSVHRAMATAGQPRARLEGDRRSPPLKWHIGQKSP